MDYYDLLGVSRNAGADDIKRAYRKRIRECHPDFGLSQEDITDRTEETAALNEAYAVLCDSARRADYDAGGAGAAEETEEQIRHRGALVLLSTLFGALLEQETSGALLEKARELLTSRLQTKTSAARHLRARVAKLTTRREKFSVAGGAENVLAAVIDGRIAQLDTQCELAEEDAARCKEALRLLGAYRSTEVFMPSTGRRMDGVDALAYAVLGMNRR